MTRVDQYRTNPSKAISNFKGRWDTVFAWPSTAISTWLNGIGGADINVSYTVTSGSAATVDYTGADGLEYRSLTFTSTSQITFDQDKEVDLLLIGGGGGGGSNDIYGTGGGGSGGYRDHLISYSSPFQLNAGEPTTITIGAGAAGSVATSLTAGSDGGTTSITVTSGGAVRTDVKGGAGGVNGHNRAGAAAPSGGGSGSGASVNGLSGFVAGGAQATYGEAGGNSRYSGAWPGYYCAGGGGGAGGGGNRTQSFTWPVKGVGTTFHTSGAGKSSTLRTGSAEWRGGGGSNNGTYTDGYGAAGFSLKGQQGVDFAGGGDGFMYNIGQQNTASVLGTTAYANTPATVNTGGGGGGVASDIGGHAGGTGGSGIVIFKIPFGN